MAPPENGEIKAKPEGGGVFLQHTEENAENFTLPVTITGVMKM